VSWSGGRAKTATMTKTYVPFYIFMHLKECLQKEGGRISLLRAE
jgi:hypothetical protein